MRRCVSIHKYSSNVAFTKSFLYFIQVIKLCKLKNFDISMLKVNLQKMKAGFLDSA